MTTALFIPYVTCTIGGSQPSAPVLSARIQRSFGNPTGTPFVKFAENLGWSQGDELTVTMGSGDNNITRFTGTVVQGAYSNSGPEVEIGAMGPLYKVQKYRNPFPKGLTLTDLTGGPATDEAIARAVLDAVGVDYSAGNIGGTGIVRGTLAAIAYTWRKGEGALDYLQRLSKASLGYRMIESTNGEIFRTQIYGRPSGGSSFSFQGGVNIFEGATMTRSIQERYDAWSVTGFDYGNGLGPVGFADPDPPGASEVFTFSSDLIERGANSDPGGGVSCEQVLEYVRAESDHEIVTIQGFLTPYDYDIGPGQTHHISDDRLGFDDQVWVLGVTQQIDGDWFVQSMDYRA
jgi:hypothetical protein